ncbi:SDR family oxidoreductase [Paenibacillus wulumuqiensis]|uniref:SDR family oxidoreductase n=1 Tax=Paenibacillus wulumuqiensis TaxID=1567107 RepID=UPI000619176B|nr:SDR family NAD(P)-dependent oxidoreductase [Paenibacillus wulumuqiensis]
MAELTLAGKTAIVTGGGSGIGKASAIRLAAEGAKVYMLDRTPEEAEKTKAEIENAGGKASVIECDVSRPEMIEQAMKQAGEESGSIDIVFANAGINGETAPIETMEIEDWNRTIEINLRGTFATVKYAIPYMKQSGGSIVITSSINGNRTFSKIGASAYATSKAGQTAFMKMAALELARYKIRVNAVCPGFIDTDIEDNTYESDDLKKVQIQVEYPDGQHPLKGEPGKAEEVANLVFFLASEQASQISGTEVFVDGTESLLM